MEVVQIALGGMLQGCIYALLALGFALVYRVTGVINLAQGGFCVLGALVTYSLQARWGWPTALAAAGGIAATTVAGGVLGALAFVPALRRVSNGNMLMLTAGLLAVLAGAMLVVWGSQPYASPPFSGDRPVALGGLLVPTQALWVFATTAALVAALWFVLQRTALGQALRACAENPAAARLMGISVPAMTLFAFSLSAAIGGAAGVVVAPSTSLQFDTGTLFTIFGFIAVAIGGIGSFPGAVAGGLLLGMANQFATAYVSSLFSNALSLGLLLAVLLWRPDGLFTVGKARRGDVREEPRVHKGIVRLGSRTVWAWSAVGLAVALALPALLPEGGLLGSLVITLILFIALLGLNVLMGYGGQVSLGQAGFMAIGGYASAALAVSYDVPPLLGTLVGMGLSLVCALVLALITMRLRGLYLALATLAFGLLVDSLAVGLEGVTGGPSGLVGIPPFSLSSFEFDTPVRMYYLVLGIVVALLLLLSGAMRSDFGRTLQAIRTDQLAAAALGVNVPRAKIVAFAVSAVLASLSGSLYAFYFNFLAPEMVGTTRSLELVTMMVIGGEGILVGPLFGAALLTVLPTAVQALSVYKTFFNGVLLVTAFLYLPEGIFGGLVRMAGGLRRRFAVPPGGKILADGGLP